MAVGMKSVVAGICIFLTACSIESISATSSSQPTCYPLSNPILHDVRFQCPLSISPSLPVQVDEDSISRALDSNLENQYAAVLFYASWCPISRSARTKFDVLSSMFPSIKHLVVDHSSAMPSVFSRYGVHSVPSILLVNNAGIERYYGPKDLQDLVNFYKRTTGLAPVEHLNEDHLNLSNSLKGVPQLWRGSSLKEFVHMEPYLALAVLFLLFRAIALAFPHIVSGLTSLWVLLLHVSKLELGIFGGASQHLGRICHVFYVKDIYSKLKIFKTRNFHEQARSARVWASSLASVSLGKSSSVGAGSLGMS